MRRRRWCVLLVGVVALSSACDEDEGFTVCGDGIVNGTEQCDDANFVVGDGCSNGCVIEPGWECEAEPPTCTPICGDGTALGPEECDDGNVDSGDGCSDQCRLESCGDGVLQPEQGEVCDDGNNDWGDGCSQDCLSDESCGNGIWDSYMDELCDEGAANADAPDATCRLDCTPQRCGDGITDPGAGERCDDGNEVDDDGCEVECLHTPSLVLPAGETASHFAVDDTHLYWSDGNIVWRRELAGGGVDQVATGVDEFIIDSTRLYWVDQPTPPGDATLLKAPVTGGATTVLTITAGWIAELEVNSTHLFWLDRDATSLSRVALTGGPAEEVVSGLSDPRFIAVDDTHLYWLDIAMGDEYLAKVPVEGGPTTLLASGLQSAGALTLDSDFVYWSENGTVYRIAKSGGTPATVTNESCSYLALDGTHLYCLTPRLFMGINQLLTAPTAGGQSHLLWYEPPLGSSGLAVGSARVYFGAAEYWTGEMVTIYSVPKDPD